MRRRGLQRASVTMYSNLGGVNVNCYKNLLSVVESI